MIKIIKKRKKKGNKTPYYKVVVHYMIGDANGETKEELKVSIDDPNVERFASALNDLEPKKGHWGIVFDSDFDAYVENGSLSQEDCDFLDKLGEEDYELSHLIRGETEYSFLVFEGVYIYYYDEYGVKNDTKIVVDKIK